MNTVAIVGVGLIGGSFGLALRKAGFTGELLGVSRPSSIEAGVTAGAISRGVTLAEAAERADLIYLAQPIDHILETIERLAPMVRPECLITDAGSTKAVIVAKACEYLKKPTFIGGHPMAGKAQRGVEHGDAELFRGKPYVLTPVAPDNNRTEELREWLLRLGCIVIDMEPSEHDRTVALTSHLPQLLSTTLAAMLAATDSESVSRIHGPGLLDMTRLALSAPEVWMSVLETNKPAVLTALRTFGRALASMESSLERSDVSGLFMKAAAFAKRLRDSGEA